MAVEAKGNHCCAFTFLFCLGLTSPVISLDRDSLFFYLLISSLSIKEVSTATSRLNPATQMLILLSNSHQISNDIPLFSTMIHHLECSRKIECLDDDSVWWLELYIRITAADQHATCLIFRAVGVSLRLGLV